MANPFTQNMFNKPKKNKFDLSHDRKLSCKFAQLYPILHEEILPGDNFSVNSEIFVRFAPLLAPIMGRIDVQTHYFFVPNRLLWANWEQFITGGDDSAEQAQPQPEFPVFPMIESTKALFSKGTLSDYFGLPIPKGTLPTNTADAIHISALPFQAYSLIYDEYYRDENLITKQTQPLIDGVNPVQSLHDKTIQLKERAWAKDYFTTALPWTQKGGEAELPIAYDPTEQTVILNSLSGTPASGALTASAPNGYMNADGTLARIQPSELQAVKINDLRKAVKLQTWLEKQARGGTRYIEQIFAHFGVKSSDSRLQRPEFLGSGSQVVQISEVLATTQTDPTLKQGQPQGATGQPVGAQAGHGISSGSSHGFRSKSFEEHGQLIGIMSVIPKASYQQNLHRKWRKFDKFDYYWPDFAHLGEQPLYMTEIFCEYTADSKNNNDVAFGYQQRYAEYKYAVSTISGDYRDNLAFWHQSRIFTTKPFLNQTFISCRPRTDIFAVQDDSDYLWVQIYNAVSAIRPIPYFSVPEL